MTDYPRHREVDVVLRDGSTVFVRPVVPADEPLLNELLAGLSRESLALRFFSGGVDVAAEADRQANVDFVDRFGLIAFRGLDPRPVAHAMWVAIGAGRAEIAFEVDDGLHGMGLGTVLLGLLVDAAADSGLRTLQAVVLSANEAMLRVFRDSGLDAIEEHLDDEVRVMIPTRITEDTRNAFAAREAQAATRAIASFFAPASIAVIGASRKRGSVGSELLHNLLTYGFHGRLVVVNPNAAEIQGVAAFASIAAIPAPIEMAIVAVPAGSVIDVARECAAAGVRALVVISSGFAEVGEAGRARQNELLRVCRTAGMRVVGPNCFGLVNTDPAVMLNGTFGPVTPVAGGVALASQSGALGIAVLDYARHLGLGVSSFVSIGNRADISSNDLLSYWEKDERTKLILLYLESLGNPRNFSRIARRVSRTKPIALVKGGRSVAGARASASHTGALVAGSEGGVAAVCRAAGLIRADTLEELFDVAALLANQPLPRGRGVGIVTNVGGPGILCADACESAGLSVPELSDRSRAALREFLPAEASVANPVDMIATASAEQFRRALEVVSNDPGIHAVVVIFLQPLATGAVEVAEAVAESSVAPGKPILAVFLPPDEARAEFARRGAPIPVYAFPESAARALRHAVERAEWLRRAPSRAVVVSGVRRDEARRLVDAALARGEEWLTPGDVRALLECYGLRMPRERIVDTPAAAARASVEVGLPVALKAVSPTVVHKTDVGAVCLDLDSPDRVETEARQMAARLTGLGHAVEHFEVQEMVPQGVEVLVGMVNAGGFGPLVACGAGGVLTELTGDVATRMAPLDERDAREMLESLRAWRLLNGYRGSPPADIRALEGVIHRVSALADDVAAIAELDCNPVVVLEDGAVVVDARVRIAEAVPTLPLGARE